MLYLPEIWYAMTQGQLQVVVDEQERARGLVERTVDKPFIVDEKGDQ